MRTLILLLTPVLVGFIALNRQRIYLRDPLAAMYRNDVKVEGAAVFINYSNDVLIQINQATQIQEYLVQGWNRTPSVPAELRCLQALACLAASDHTTAEPIHGASQAEMSSREVHFKDGNRTAVRITLR